MGQGLAPSEQGWTGVSAGQTHLWGWWGDVDLGDSGAVNGEEAGQSHKGGIKPSS